MKVISEYTTHLRKTKIYEIRAFGKVFKVKKWWECDDYDVFQPDYEIANKEVYDLLTETQQDKLIDFVMDLS